MPTELPIRIGRVVLGLTSIVALASGQERSLNVTSAKGRVGEVVTVCGHATEYGCRRPYTTLTLAPASDPLPFQIQIVDDDGTRFGARVEERFLGRVICVRGQVEKLSRNYRLSVADPNLLTVVDDERVSPWDPFAPDAHGGCDPGVVLPKLLRDVQPRYTADALGNKIEGTVLIRGVVKVDGTVGQMQVLRPVEPGLDLEALRAFGQWRFEAGTYLGTPAPIVVLTEMTFTIKK